MIAVIIVIIRTQRPVILAQYQIYIFKFEKQTSLIYKHYKSCFTKSSCEHSCCVQVNTEILSWSGCLYSVRDLPI
jgi:hypothetical protein